MAFEPKRVVLALAGVQLADAAFNAIPTQWLEDDLDHLGFPQDLRFVFPVIKGASEPAVTAFIPRLQARGARRTLDVGAGIGRHSLAYARAGLEVVAVDASSTGIDELVRTAAAASLDVDARVAPFTDLPLEDDT